MASEIGPLTSLPRLHVVASEPAHLLSSSAASSRVNDGTHPAARRSSNLDFRQTTRVRLAVADCVSFGLKSSGSQPSVQCHTGCIAFQSNHPQRPGSSIKRPRSRAPAAHVFAKRPQGFPPQPLICRNRNFSAEPQSFLSCKKAILASASPNPADAEPVAGWPMAARSAVASQRWCGRTPEPTQCCQRPEIADAIPRPPRVRRAARTRRGLLQLVPR
jgi:hypothetical protein